MRSSYERGCLAKTLLHCSPQTVRRHCWRGLLTTVENRFKPGLAHFERSSSGSPLGKAMLLHSRCFVTDPSGEDYRRRTVSEICGGYKAVKFRFLLFLWIGVDKMLAPFREERALWQERRMALEELLFRGISAGAPTPTKHS
jgi:hypothetical protein